MSDLRTITQHLVIDKNGRYLWDQLRGDLVVPLICDFVKKEMKANAQAKEIVFELVGDDFVEEHFPDMERDRKLLHIPYMTPDMKVALMHEFEGKLLTFLEKKLSFGKSKGVERLRGHAVGSMFFNKIGEICQEESKYEDERNSLDVMSRYVTQNYDGSGFGFPLAMKKNNWDASCKRLGETHPDNPDPLCHGSKNEEMGLVQDPVIWRKKQNSNQSAFLSRCKGRCVPPSIRRFIFHKLFYEERLVLECAQEIERNLSDRALPMATEQELRSTQSKIHTLLTRLVEEAFRTNLKLYYNHDKDDEQLARRKQTICTMLNQYFVMNGHHQPAVLMLLTPFYIHFEDSLGYSQIIILSMLSKARDALPSRKDSGEISKQIWQEVLHLDLRLTESIRQIIENHRVQTESTEEFDPYMLFIPWVENALVGFLKPEALYFVWVQCLLDHLIDPETFPKVWNLDKFVKMGAHIFVLLKVSLQSVQSFSELQRLVKDLPLQIQTKDLQKTVQHVCVRVD